MPLHPCVREAVDNRQVEPRPHPPGHQVKAQCSPLWRQPIHAGFTPAGPPLGVSIRQATKQSLARRGPAGPTRVRVEAPAIGGQAVRTSQPGEDEAISCAHDAGGQMS